MTNKPKGDAKFNKEKDTKIRLSKLDIEKAVAEYLRDKLGNNIAVDLLLNNEELKKEEAKKETLRVDIEKAVKKAIEKEEIKKKVNERKEHIKAIKLLSKKYPETDFDIPPELFIEEPPLFTPETFSIQNVYDSEKFWNNGAVKKPTLLELEKYYKIAIDREYKERSVECWIEFKEERNNLLQKTDWTQLPDVGLDQKERMFYREYRKYLRNKTKDYRDDNIQKWTILSFKEFKQMKFPG